MSAIIWSIGRKAVTFRWARADMVALAGGDIVRSARAGMVGLAGDDVFAVFAPGVFDVLVQCPAG
jgi:hypothetical protein